MQATSDGATKKGHLMILTDASQDIWERRWFVLKRCEIFNEQVQLLIVAQTISTYLFSFK